jgi:hypothetical protein
MQRLIIRFEHDDGVQEVHYEQPDIVLDDVFWNWFNSSWSTLGFPSISEDLKKR